MSEPRRPAPESARDEFLAMVSHELRSPLNGIKSWAHVLERQVRDAGGDPLAEKAVAGILAGIDQQVALIEELEDAARVLGGSFAPSRQPMRLDEALGDAIRAASAAAASKRVEIVATRAGAPALVHGDFARLQQVLLRLLDHAIRFSPPGGRVRTECRLEDGSAYVEIHDDGPPVSSEALPNLFDPWGGADTARGSRAPRTGLALAVCRRIAELHGGRLSCASDARGGATFALAVPALHAAAPA